MNTPKCSGIKRSNSYDLDIISKRPKLDNENIHCQVYKMKCSILNSDPYNMYNSGNKIDSLIYNNNSDIRPIENCRENNLNNNNFINMNICSNKVMSTDPLLNEKYDKKDVENEFLNNSEYERINYTLGNLHKSRKIQKDIIKSHNNDINSNPVYTDFYSRINSQLKSLHITNLKQHKRIY